MIAWAKARVARIRAWANDPELPWWVRAIRTSLTHVGVWAGGDLAVAALGFALHIVLGFYLLWWLPVLLGADNLLTRFYVSREEGDTREALAEPTLGARIRHLLDSTLDWLLPTVVRTAVLFGAIWAYAVLG